jgi:hypothetical protein
VKDTLERVGLVTLIAIASLNIWTGAPMLALWVGSQVQGGGPTKMSTVFLVVVTLGATVLLLVRLVAILQSRYERVGGRSPVTRAHVPWLRSMRGERKVYPGEQAHLTAPERVLVIVTVCAIVAFEIWFFFFSGSPFDQRSGRD